VNDETNAKDLSRRTALRWMAVAAPAVAALGGAALGADQAKGEAKAETKPEEPKLSEEARFTIRNEPGLSDAERARLEKQLPAFEGALKKLRDFDLADDVEPAVRFRALRAPEVKR
jgi:hypothetical protein